MKKNNVILGVIFALMAAASLLYIWKQDTFTLSGVWTAAEDMEERISADEYPRWTFTCTSSDKGAEILRMPLFLEKAGTYTLVLDYTDTSPGTCMEITADPAVTTDNREISSFAVIRLEEKPEQSLKYTFTLPYDAENVMLRLYSGGAGTITVGRVYVQSTFRYYSDTLWILLFAAALILPLVIEVRRKGEFSIISRCGGLSRVGEWLFVLTAGFISSFPVLKRSLDYCVDLQFHLMRILGLSAELRAGNFPFRLQSLWFGGRGYPVGWYYPDFIILFPAVMTSLGASLYIAYKIFVISINIATAFIALHYVKKASGSQYFGLFFSAAYTFSLYRLMNLFSRGDPAESAAMAFLPMLLYALYSVIVRKNFRDFPLISVSFALILGSHLLSAVLAVFLCLFFAAALIREFTLKTALSAAMSAVLAFLLGSGYLIPLILNLDQPFYMLESGTQIEKTPVDITQLFTLFPNTASGNLLGSSTMNEMSVGVGFLCGIGLLLYAIVRICFRADSWWAVYRPFTDACAVGALFFSWISTPLFLWKYVRDIPVLGSLLVRFQFAWRFNNITTVLYCLLLAFSLEVLRQHCGKSGAFTPAVLLCILVSFAPFADNCVMTHYPYMENKYEWALDFDRQSEVKDYLYSDLNPVTERAKTATIQAEGLQVSSYERKGMRLIADLTEEKKPSSDADKGHGSDYSVQLPLLYYPGYSVTLDGNPAAFFEGPEHAVMLAVPTESFSSGKPVRLEACYRGTAAELAGLALSIIAALACAVYFRFNPSPSTAPPPEA